MFVLAFGIGYYLFVKMFKIDHESEKSLDTIFTWTLIGTILGARLGHVIFYQPELFKQDFWSVFFAYSDGSRIQIHGIFGTCKSRCSNSFGISTIIIAIKVLKKIHFGLLDRLAITVALAGFLSEWEIFQLRNRRKTSTRLTICRIISSTKYGIWRNCSTLSYSVV